MLSLVLSTALAAPSPVDVAQESLRASMEVQHRDATIYTPSPYASVEDLPPVIEVERSYQGWNDFYYFALVDGRLYYKPRFKRPAMSEEWVTELAWKPLGLNNGLPYRLKRSADEKNDTTWADGDRGNFVHDMHFVDAQEDPAAWLDPALWDQASTWDGQPEFADDFTRPERLIALTADDDEVAVLSEDRQMFYRRKYANIFVPDDWNEGWGQAKTLHVVFPDHLTGHKGWSLGRITAFGTGYKEGPDGRIFEWGPAAVSMETMVWLSPDGRIIYYLDSGTPPEVEHYVEAPFRGQWRGEAINSAASTVMLLDRFGGVYTKIADFDLLGSTPTHPYCYLEECDDEPYYAPGDIRSGMSDIRLPPEGWQLHPPILPPEAWGDDTWVSTRISILPTGKGNAERELRVVGSYSGEIGTWRKKLRDATWQFKPAAPGDQGFAAFEGHERLTPEDQAKFATVDDLEGLHAEEPSLDHALTGKLQLTNGVVVDAALPTFNRMASPWTLEISWRDVTLPLDLHVVQAWNPNLRAHPSDRERYVLTYEGTLGFDRRALEERIGAEASSAEGLAVREMLDAMKNNKFALIVDTTEHGTSITRTRRRRTPFFQAVLLDETVPAPATNDLDAWEEAFWSTLPGAMGWVGEAETLRLRAPALSCDDEGPVQWAALVRELDDQIAGDLKQIKQVKRSSRRFARFTFFTSGAFYLLQVKTVDAALDKRREWRDADVRPNELRFNVVSGVTSRIPYLSRNISQVEAERLVAARQERDDAMLVLAPLLADADAIEKMCR